MEEWYQSNKVSFQRNRGCMVNYRNVSYALGVLVLVEAGVFALCAGVSFYYQEEDYIHFLETLLINVVLGGLLLLQPPNCCPAYSMLHKNVSYPSFEFPRILEDQVLPYEVVR